MGIWGKTTCNHTGMNKYQIKYSILSKVRAQGTGVFKKEFRKTVFYFNKKKFTGNLLTIKGKSLYL